MTGIYCIKVNNAIVYVGQSKHIRHRIKEHWKEFGKFAKNLNGKYGYLHSAYEQYIPISFWLLELCREDLLNEREKFWIDSIQPILNSTIVKRKLAHEELSAQEFFEIVFNQDNKVSGSMPILD